jgi:hypothetical protein
MDVRLQWAHFLGEYEWNYFITCRTPYKIYTRTVSSCIDKLYCNSSKVDKVFYVAERDKGDYSNNHVHMLIDTNSSITYPELRHALGDISVGNYQEVYDKAQVCKYVTKHIDKGIDYELTFRHNIPSNK